MLFICSLASDQSFMSKPSNRYNRVRYKQIYNKIINAFALIYYLCVMSLLPSFLIYLPYSFF